MALYALVGFFIVPLILRPRLVDAISKQTNCPVAIGGIRVNPFSLSLTVQDFALMDRHRKTICSFRELYVNFEMISLFRRAYTFSQIHLSKPYIYVGIRPDGSINLKDLQQDSDDPPPDTVSSPPVRVIIQDLSIDTGKVVFEDSSRRIPFREVVDSLGFSLTDFTTVSDEAGGYTFEASTGQNELIRWKGNFSVVPLRSTGSFELKNIHARRIWEYLQQSVQFEVVSGQVDFSAEYTLDLSRKKTFLELRNGSLETRTITLSSSLDSVRAIDLPLLSLSGMQLDYTNRNISIGLVSTKGLHLTNVVAPDGQVTLKGMFQPKNPPAAVPPKQKSPPWKILLKRIECSSAAFHNEDRSTNPPAGFDIDSIHATMDSLRLDRPAPATVSLTGKVNQSGTAKINGTMIIDVDSASVDATQDLDCSEISLVPFQPYLNDYSKAEIQSGTLSTRGRLHVFLQGPKRLFDFDGNVECAGLRVTDPFLHEDFARCTRLELNTMAFHQSSRSFSVKEIVARQPYLRMIIGPDSVTNFRHMMVTDTLKADSTSIKRQAIQATGTSPGPRMKSRIGQVRIVDGSLNFSDLSMKPNFSVGVEELNGTISGLSSEELSRADIDLAGKVDKYAPASIKGQINPLSELAYTDVTMSFHGIELTTFTPYAGRFAGYKIDKGKLDVDLQYKLNKEHLEGQNKIIIDQLTLGDKVESPDATSLPVKLAIALLKDSHGVIDLDIPISGDLNDPKFSIMPIILKVFMNIITKAVTSPFKLLGALFGGGGEDLQYVEFTPGSDSLTTQAKTKLASLAKGLTERPNLSLEIRGVAADTLDRKTLAEDTVFSKIRPRLPHITLVDNLTPEQSNSLLDLYKETFKDDAKNLLPPPPEGQKEISKDERERDISRAAFAKLAGAVNVSDEALRSLAGGRADAVKSYVILNCGIGEERIFLTDVNTKGTPKDGLVQMELSLTAK